jgi:hypothetical protein
MHLSVSNTPKNDNNDIVVMDNHSAFPKDCISNVKVYPELAQYLKQHLLLHEESPNADIYTSIETKDDELFTIHLKGKCYWMDEQEVKFGGENSGLCLLLNFPIWEDESQKEYNVIENERLQRLRNLDLFSLFIPHKSYDGGDCHREYAMDLGNDIEKASILLSFILQKVYLIPISEELEIFTEQLDDESNDNNNHQEINTEEYDETDQTYSEADSTYEDEDDSAGIIMKILCFLFPIIGFILYFVKKNNYPNSAKSYITWSAIGFGVLFLSCIMS